MIFQGSAGAIVPARCSSLPSLDATAPLPTCLLCGHASPPGRMGWLSAGDDQRLFSVCGDCAWNCDDAELEAKIVAQVSDSRPAAVAAETMTHTGLRPAAPATWVETAAKAWAHPAVQPARPTPAA